MPEDIKKCVAKFPDKYIIVNDAIINLSELKAIVYKDCKYYNERYVNKKEEKNNVGK